MSVQNVRRAIVRARERISSHREYLVSSELRTRAVLIDPVLGALGWDVSDPSVVGIELGANGGFADYTLLHPATGVPVMILEAKRLGVDRLVPVTRQVGGYSDDSGARMLVITNGNLWHVYRNVDGPMVGSNLMALSLTGDDVDRCARTLVQFLGRSRYAPDPSTAWGRPRNGQPITLPLLR